MKKIDINIKQDGVEVSTFDFRRLTKDEEINLIQALVAQLPDGYLRDTLRHIKIQFEHDVRSDFPCIPNLALIEQQIAERDKERVALTVQLNQLQEDQKHLRTELRQLRHKALETSKHVRDQAMTLENWARSLNRAINDLAEQ